MSGFDAGWLRRREPFDTAARSVELARRFAETVRAGPTRPTRIVDLAAGTGASFRALAPLIGGEQEWLLVDNDPLLIAEQASEIARWARDHTVIPDRAAARSYQESIQSYGSPLSRGRRRKAVIPDRATKGWRVRARTLDLAHQLEEIDLTGCDGVTTTAFLDLVSTPWLDRLCEFLARRRTPFLAALTVDGRRDWQPPLPADARIAETFSRHQTIDKGFGPAAGPIAASYLQNQLIARGYEVTIARSDWHIGPADRDMLQHLIDESAAIGLDAEWPTARRAQLEDGVLSVEIGHVDLLAVYAK